MVHLIQAFLKCMLMFLLSLVSLESNPIDDGLPWDPALTLGSVSRFQILIHVFIADKLLTVSWFDVYFSLSDAHFDVSHKLSKLE